MPGSLISGFLWNWWRRKCSRHSRRMHNPQFYISGKRPIEILQATIPVGFNVFALSSIYVLLFRNTNWCWKISSAIGDKSVILTVVFLSIGTDVIRVKSGEWLKVENVAPPNLHTIFFFKFDRNSALTNLTNNGMTNSHIWQTIKSHPLYLVLVSKQQPVRQNVKCYSVQNK